MKIRKEIYQPITNIDRMRERIKNGGKRIIQTGKRDPEKLEFLLKIWSKKMKEIEEREWLQTGPRKWKYIGSKG